MSTPHGILFGPLRIIVRGLFEPLLARSDRSLPSLFLPLLLIIVLTWLVTVPVHELLHAAGCLLLGGSVRELTLQPLYGGALLERIIPFVRAGGDYAGQLSDFDTRGSDLCYLVTVAFPYLLTLLLGVPLLSLALRTGNRVAHGVGMVHTLMPLISAGGDYYEIGSILATRLFGWEPDSAGAQLVRGDDLLLVAGRVSESGVAGGMTVVGVGFLLGLSCIWLTWFLSCRIAAWLVKIPLEKGEIGE